MFNNLVLKMITDFAE